MDEPDRRVRLVAVPAAIAIPAVGEDVSPSLKAGQA
jgi:hypothetical protein